MSKPIKAAIKRARGRVIRAETGNAFELTLEPQQDMPPGHHPPTMTYLLFVNQVVELRDAMNAALTEMGIPTATPPPNSHHKH
jgi:hypothetical protein